ncbi:MAG: mechanosensitive ion channel domain-containing protein [Rhodothermales bacterium]
MVLPRLALSLVLALAFALGGPAAAQQAADSVAPQTVAPTPTARDTAASPPATAVVPQAAPATRETVPPQTADDVRAELATLRAAVLGLAAQNDSLMRSLGTVAGLAARNDSLARALARRPARDTTARATAQATIDDVAGTATQALQNFGPKLLVSILLVILALYIVRGFVWLLEELAARGAERRLFYKKLIPIVRLLVWAFTVYLVITAVFRIPGNSLLAAAAAVGVAVGFAAQEVLKNIFGGIVIILDQPFQVGDKIAVGGTYGEVVSIGLRSTRIVTPDDNLVSVPNSQVVADQVANANAGELNLQVVTDLYLPGWVDVALAKRIAYAAAANSKYVYLDKPIVVIVKDEFKETFLLHLKVKAYVLDTRYEFLLMSDVTEAAKVEFLRTGLLRPMPTVDAYVDALNDMNEEIVDERSGERPSGDGANGDGASARRAAPHPQPESPPDTA